MFNEGLYGLDYQAASEQPDVIGSGLAVLRDGKILGTDRCGSIFIGNYEYDRISAVSWVNLSLQVAPESELVTGFATGADGATIDIVAAIAKPATQVVATVDVAGRPVTVKLTWIGPLPN